jgi:hypothetical protein
MKKDGQLAFVQKTTDQIWYLKQWSPVTDKQEIIVKMPSGSEDFAILPDGSFRQRKDPFCTPIHLAGIQNGKKPAIWVCMA